MPLTKDIVIEELKKLISTLETQGVAIESAYLFGSYASGKADDWSDIDIALVSKDFSKVRFEVIKLIIPLLREFNSHIEVHPYHSEDFTPEDLFIKEILKYGVKIK